MSRLLLLVLSLTCHLEINLCVILTQPEQIHINYGNSPSEMVVTWVTLQETFNSSIVEYGHDKINQRAFGKQEKFIDGGVESRKLFMHRVVLTNLKPGTKYYYHVGSPTEGWSEVYWFNAMRAGVDWSPRIAVFGDMGNENAKSLPSLQEEAQRSFLDAVFHVGDFAYNMDDDNARVGDAFMNQIQVVAAYLPYMTAVGNHEQAYNFSNYKNRFSMPGGDGQSIFYSFDIGPAHVIAFSSELYYYAKYGWKQIIHQYEWMERDLQKANQPENRAKRPWIITMCHRPMYCSNQNDPEHCLIKDNLIRVGIPLDRAYGMEDLLYKYGVDLHLQAHEHSYERFFPVYNNTVCNGSTAEPYTNPRAPVHILAGSGGCDEGVDPFVPLPGPWSAFRSDDYGYLHLTIQNRTHLFLQQISVEQGLKVIDEIAVIKNKHGPQTFNCKK